MGLLHAVGALLVFLALLVVALGGLQALRPKFDPVNSVARFFGAGPATTTTPTITA